MSANYMNLINCWLLLQSTVLKKKVYEHEFSFFLGWCTGLRGLLHSADVVSVVYAMISKLALDV